MKRFLFWGFFICCSFCFCQNDALSYLALGDSYTAATSELPQNGWPQQLVTYLNKKKIDVKDPLVIAGPGWTTEKLLDEVQKKGLGNDFGLVSLMIGVNNQYRGLDFDGFKKEFLKLLQKSITFTGGDASHVVVVSVPDWSVTPFAKFKNKAKITKELKNYNTFIQTEAKKNGALFVDVTPASKNMAIDKTLIATDSLHPSKKMYRIWAKKVGRELLKTL
ncbi:GDSL-type esterase/lipase family protein [Allomuricauda sp. d1]|uniref:SGNH/GDSL hydrolase family protein n=1 Tax=Allomuricauda sp. d1 TaxID=3136725 RepID=UPI0031E2F478